MTLGEFQEKYEPYNVKWDYHPVYWGEEIIEDIESILQCSDEEYSQVEFSKDLILKFKDMFIESDENPICPDKPYCLRFVGPDGSMLIAKKKGKQFIGNKERIITNPNALNSKKTGKSVKERRKLKAERKKRKQEESKRKGEKGK